MTCKNICKRHEDYRTHGKHTYKYGGKYCNICEAGFITKDLFCKCCGQKYRTKPRSTYQEVLNRRERERQAKKC